MRERGERIYYLALGALICCRCFWLFSQAVRALLLRRPNHCGEIMPSTQSSQIITSVNDKEKMCSSDFSLRLYQVKDQQTTAECKLPSQIQGHLFSLLENHLCVSRRNCLFKFKTISFWLQAFFLVILLFLTMTTHSRYTEENCSVSRVQSIGCITIMKRPPGWIEPRGRLRSLWG